MKKSDLQQIIKEEIQSILNENISKNIIGKFQNKTGPEGLIISKLTVLEKTHSMKYARYKNKII
jgi:hypothetical protein